MGIKEKRIKKLLTIFIFMYLSIICVYSEQQQAFSPPERDLPNTMIESISSDTNKPISSVISSETSSRGEYNIGAQEPAISVEKYIKGIYGVCNKHDNITVELRVLNCDLTNTLQKVTIMEEIPKGFKFINAYPKNDTSNDGMIRWNCGNSITYMQYFNYTIKAEESGPHIIPSTLIDATIKDRLANEYRMLKSSANDLGVTVLNQKPEIKIDPEPPIYIWRFINPGHNLTTTTINAEIVDPDGDIVTGTILPTSNKTISEPMKHVGIGRSKYEWILPVSTDKESKFKIRAFDGTDYTDYELAIEPYIIPYPGDVSILVAVGALLGALVSRIYTHRDKIKEMICNCNFW